MTIRTTLEFELVTGTELESGDAVTETVNGEVRLTFAAYRKLGGLDGAIDKGAEAAIEALGETEHAALPRSRRRCDDARSSVLGAGRRSLPGAHL